MKKNLNLCLKWHILKSDHFEGEITSEVLKLKDASMFNIMYKYKYNENNELNIMYSPVCL